MSSSIFFQCRHSLVDTKTHFPTKKSFFLSITLIAIGIITTLIGTFALFSTFYQCPLPLSIGSAGSIGLFASGMILYFGGLILSVALSQVKKISSAEEPLPSAEVTHEPDPYLGPPFSISQKLYEEFRAFLHENEYSIYQVEENNALIVILTRASAEEFLKKETVAIQKKLESIKTHQEISHQVWQQRCDPLLKDIRLFSEKLLPGEVYYHKDSSRFLIFEPDPCISSPNHKEKLWSCLVYNEEEYRQAEQKLKMNAQGRCYMFLTSNELISRTFIPQENPLLGKYQKIHTSFINKVKSFLKPNEYILYRRDVHTALLITENTLDVIAYECLKRSLSQIDKMLVDYSEMDKRIKESI